MALLGGLLRGTSGAFIRGSIGAASDMLQQTALRDEEEIKQGVQTFGGKYDNYKQNLAEYQKETDLIDEVASVLDSQNDESIKDLDDDGLKGYAQSLISASGAQNAGQAIEFFTKHRRVLTPVAMDMPSNNVNPTVSLDANGQTTALLDENKTSQQKNTGGGFMGVLRKVFTGKDSDEINNEIARKAGVSRETYDKVMSGFSPNRPQPSVGISIGVADESEKLIKELNPSVLQAIQPSENNPLYRSDEGKALANAYLSNYNAWGTKKQGALSNDEMLTLQNEILTFAMPENANAFLSVFDDDITSLTTRVHSGDLPADIAEKAMPILRSLAEDKMALQMDIQRGGPKANDTAFAAQYADKVFELADMLNLENNKEVFDIAKTLLNQAMSHARSNSDYYEAATLETLFSMPEVLGDAIKNNDTSILGAIHDVISIVPEKPKGVTAETDYQRRRAHLITYLKSEQGGGFNQKEAELAATEYMVKQDALVSVDGVPFEFRNGNLQRVQIVRPGTTVREPSPDTRNENLRKMSSNNDGIFRTGRAISILRRSPNAANLIGQFMVLRGQDFDDLANTVSRQFGGDDFVNLVPDDIAKDVQDFKTTTIPLISQAKDALFDDPRLSDQDLRIVLSYVAVLNDQGIGSTRGIQALLGIQEAIMMDSMIRDFENRPDTPIANFSPSNGALNFLTADGKKIDYDSTLAGKYYKRIAEAQGIRLITDLSEYQGMTEEEQNAYLATVNPINTMVARAVQRTTAFKQDNYQVDQFRTRYMNDSFLTELPGGVEAAYIERHAGGDFNYHMAQGRAAFELRTRRDS